MKKILFLCVVLSISMFGCGGSDPETAGTLTMSDIASTDLSGGTYKVDATAAYAPDSGKEATGAEINFTAIYTTPSNATPVTRTSKYVLSKSGIATYTDLVVQGNEPVYLRLTASIGGLSQVKIASIPAVAGLTASPAAISFVNTDTVGTAKTVTVSGGYLPYTVASAIPLDIRADISGSAVTITKMASGSTTNASTTVTITDNKGNTYTVPVGYYK